jgi:hypothetical protein
MNYFDATLGMPSSEFWLEDSLIVFTAERCSNHAMAALDDIWSFSVPMYFPSLEMYANDNAKNLFFETEGAWSSSEIGLPDEKVLHGFLDGKYAITAILTGLRSGYIYGSYWYDKYQRPIELHGNVGEYVVTLFEEHKGETTATLELMWQHNELMGVWEDSDGNRSFPIVFRVN